MGEPEITDRADHAEAAETSHRNTSQHILLDPSPAQQGPKYKTIACAFFLSLCRAHGQMSALGAAVLKNIMQRLWFMSLIEQISPT